MGSGQDAGSGGRSVAVGCHDSTPVHARVALRQLLPCDVTLHRSPTGPALPSQAAAAAPASMAATATRSAGRVAATEAASPRLRAYGPPTRPSCTAAAVAAGLGGGGVQKVASPRAAAGRSQDHRMSGCSPSCRCSGGPACLRGSSPCAPCWTRCGKTSVACRSHGRPCAGNTATRQNATRRSGAVACG